MADRIEIGWLFDFYGPLLTERQQKLLALYCNEDFSLSEIAAQTGYSSPVSLSLAFRRATGMQPGAYRELRRG